MRRLKDALDPKGLMNPGKCSSGRSRTTAVVADDAVAIARGRGMPPEATATKPRPREARAARAFDLDLLVVLVDAQGAPSALQVPRTLAGTIHR
jgi:hypothetical protein